MNAKGNATGREKLLHAVIDHFATHGVDNQTLRGIASATGTSHRMLIYHFGSREGLLAEVVDAVELLQREIWTTMIEAPSGGSPRDLAERFWSETVESMIKYGPLFFELSAHAMQGRPYARTLATNMIEPWLEILTAALIRDGVEARRARTQARLGLAAVRGLILDLLITGDRSGVDDAYRLLIDITSRPDDDENQGISITGSAP